MPTIPLDDRKDAIHLLRWFFKRLKEAAIVEEQEAGYARSRVIAARRFQDVLNVRSLQLAFG